MMPERRVGFSFEVEKRLNVMWGERNEYWCCFIFRIYSYSVILRCFGPFKGICEEIKYIMLKDVMIV